MKKMMLIIGLLIGVVVMIFYYESSRAIEDVKTETINTPSFNKIEIDVSNADIKLKSGNKYKVIYKGKKQLKPKIKVDDDTLHINSANMSVNINGNIFDLFNNRHAMVPLVTIVLPEKELKDLDVDNSNGNFTSDDVIINRANIDLSNGNVRIKRSNAQGLDLATSNGYVSINGKKQGSDYSENTSAKKLIEVDNSNGNIEIN